MKYSKLVEGVAAVGGLVFVLMLIKGWRDGRKKAEDDAARQGY